MIDRRHHGDVAVLCIDRPERRNALDAEHCEALRAAVAAAVGAGARVLVVTGVGDAFCAGADFAEVADAGFRRALYDLLGAIAGAAVPVVAAVNGPAIGAGLQLAIACDLRVAGPSASFAVPSSRLGLAVDPWTIRRLATLAGAGTGAWLLLASRTLTVDEAVARGLVEARGDLDDAVALAGEIGGAAPLSLRYSKQALQAAGDRGADAQVEAAFAACWASEDAIEGLRARAERRPPDFRGVVPGPSPG